MLSWMLIGLLGLACLGIFLFHLIGRSEPWDLDLSEGTLSRLRRERDRILRTIHDIEVEHETGTLTAEELSRLRNELKREGVQKIRALQRVRRRRVRNLNRRIGIPASVVREVEQLVSQRKESS